MSKKGKWSIGGGVIVIATAVVLVMQFVLPSRGGGTTTAKFSVPSAQAAEPIGYIGTSRIAVAIEQAGRADKYVFALFYRDENEQTTKARELIASARKKIDRKSEEVEINIVDPSEQDVVTRFGTSRAPTPLVLVIAPNGAIMGGFPANQLTDDAKLVDAIGCKASEQTLKALQMKNMVALCVQSRKTADNFRAMSSVEEFVKDPKYAATTAVVTADPTNDADATFLTKLGVDLKSPVATTVLLAPPGSVIGTFQGATAKDKLVAAVQAAAAPKAGGCCPPGSGKSCGPTGAPVAPQRTMTTGQPSTKSPVQVQKVPATTAPTASSISATNAATAPSTSASPTTSNQGK